MIGSLASGPLHLGHIELRGVRRRPVIAPIVVGLLLAGLFVLGGLLFRLVPVLAGLTVATLLAFVSGYASIAFLLRFLAQHSTFVFVAYRVALGSVVLVLVSTGAIS